LSAIRTERGPEPNRKWELRVVKDRSRRQRYLAPTARTLPTSQLGQFASTSVLALRILKTVRPSTGSQIRPAPVFGGELRLGFQKKMRHVSLQIPEPGATGYQNLMRQNPKLTRSDAIRFGRRLNCPQITALLECVTAPGQDGMRFALFLFKFSVFNDLYRKQVFRAADHTYRNPLYPSSPR
jgi:hypothetical protein